MENSTFIRGQKFSTEGVVSEALGSFALDHIQSKYQPLRHAQEILAQAAHVTPATAVNWLRRRCAPQADSLGTYHLGVGRETTAIPLHLGEQPRT